MCQKMLVPSGLPFGLLTVEQAVKVGNAEAEAAWEQRTEAKVAKAEDDLKEAWRALGFQTIFQRRALQGFWKVWRLPYGEGLDKTGSFANLL